MGAEGLRFYGSALAINPDCINVYLIHTTDSQCCSEGQEVAAVTQSSPSSSPPLLLLALMAFLPTSPKWGSKDADLTRASAEKTRTYVRVRFPCARVDRI